jgi:hypothetical protein
MAHNWLGFQKFVPKLARMLARFMFSTAADARAEEWDPEAGRRKRLKTAAFSRPSRARQKKYLEDDDQGMDIASYYR